MTETLKLRRALKCCYENILEVQKRYSETKGMFWCLDDITRNLLNTASMKDFEKESRDGFANDRPNL